MRQEFAITIGCRFNINREEVLNLLMNNKPNFEKRQNEVICGRVKLIVKNLNTNPLYQSSLMYDKN
jgi:hypothetical protein